MSIMVAKTKLGYTRPSYSTSVLVLADQLKSPVSDLSRPVWALYWNLKAGFYPVMRISQSEHRIKNNGQSEARIQNPAN